MDRWENTSMKLCYIKVMVRYKEEDCVEEETTDVEEYMGDRDDFFFD